MAAPNLFSEGPIKEGSREDPFDWPDAEQRPATEEAHDDFGKGLAGAQRGNMRTKAANHLPRTREWAKRQGWIITKCEMKDLYQDGVMARVGKKHDLFGLFDFIALDTRGKRIIGIQVVSTSKKKPVGESFRQHVGKMCSSDIESKSGSKYVENLRAWIATGSPAYVLDWEQRAKVGNQEWFPVLREITTELIEKVIARKRK